ncbi:MAG: hypothetical protein ACFFCS_22480 [Candidatus Hodarchaeota archaeon]
MSFQEIHVAYLVFCSSIIKFLVDKYKMFLPPDLSLGGVLKKYHAGEILQPDEVGDIIKILSIVQKKCIKENLLYQIAAIRKYVGNGDELRGLLNILVDQGEDIFLCSYEPGSIAKINQQVSETFTDGLTGVTVIAPLNLDENEEIYNYFHKRHQVAVFPFTFNLLASKWTKNFFFSPNIPRSFYFPEGTDALQYIDKVKQIASSEDIKCFFLKDEFDFNSGAAVPYSISPPRNLDRFCETFYQNAKGVSNLGGLVIEEFLASEGKISIFKSHSFKEIIPGEHLHYVVSLKPYEEGSLYEPLIERVQEGSTDIEGKHVEKVNAGISKYYPFIFSSVDYIIQDDVPRVIDLNSIAGSLGYIQQLDGNDDHNPFEFFISRIKELCEGDAFQQQIEYKKKMFRLNEIIKDLGPCFIKEGTVRQMKTNEEVKVVDLLEK